MVKKEGYGGTAQRLVAIVHKVNKNDLRENEALNAAQEWLSGGPDGIRDVKNESVKSEKWSDAVYDLSGRRIADSSSVTRHSSLPSGIYIVNSRKVVIR